MLLPITDAINRINDELDINSHLRYLDVYKMYKEGRVYGVNNDGEITIEYNDLKEIFGSISKGDLVERTSVWANLLCLSRQRVSMFKANYGLRSITISFKKTLLEITYDKIALTYIGNILSNITNQANRAIKKEKSITALDIVLLYMKHRLTLINYGYKYYNNNAEAETKHAFNNTIIFNDEKITETLTPQDTLKIIYQNRYLIISLFERYK